MHGAVLYRVVCSLRHRYVTIALVALVVGLALTPGLILAAGAQRTSSAPDRYTASKDLPWAYTLTQGGGEPRTEEIAALPGVADAASITFALGGLIPAGGGPDDALDTLVFAGDPAAENVHVVQGREPREGTVEFVAPEALAAQADLHVGDHFTLVTISAASGADLGYAAEPDGPTFDATLVGTFEDELKSFGDPYSVVIFPTSLLTNDIGVKASVGVIAVKDGVSADELRAQLDSLGNGSDFSIAPFELVGDDVRSAVSVQSSALYVLAGVVLAAALVVLTQLLVRQFRTPGVERSTLRALGYVDSQTVTESVLCAAPAIVAGAALATTVAWACSGWFPYGFARQLEPDPGRRFDWVGHAAAAVVLTTVLLGLVALLTARSEPSRRPSLVIDRLATLAPTPTGAIGVRLAFGHSRRAGSTNGWLACLVAVLATVVASLTVGSSVNSLLDHAANWGDASDIGYGEGGDSVPADMVSALRQDPSVRALTLYGANTVEVGSATLPVVAYQPVEGSEVPEVLSGRLPQADDEVALGTRVMKRLHLHVGDTLHVTATSGPEDFAVVGTAVLPSIEESDTYGEGALVDLDGLVRIDPSDGMSTLGVFLTKDHTTADLERVAAVMNLDLSEGHQWPTPVANLQRVRNVPYVIAAVVGALALISLVELVASAQRRRHRDLAVLAALGASRGWVGRAAHWQASLIAGTAAVLAVPIGVAVGRVIYPTFPERLGARVVPHIPSGVAGVAGGVRARGGEPGRGRRRQTASYHHARSACGVSAVSSPSHRIVVAGVAIAASSSSSGSGTPRW